MQLVHRIARTSNTFLAFIFISSLFVLNILESEIMGTTNSSRIFCASCNGLSLKKNMIKNRINENIGLHVSERDVALTRMAPSGHHT